MEIESVIFILFIIIVWGGVSTLVGLAGKERRIGFWGAFFVTLFLGLLLGLIITLVSPKLTNTIKIIRCDGCKGVINGEYIAIRPKEIDIKLDYCNENCRDNYHTQNMERLLTINN